MRKIAPATANWGRLILHRISTRVFRILLEASVTAQLPIRIGYWTKCFLAPDRVIVCFARGRRPPAYLAACRSVSYRKHRGLRIGARKGGLPPGATLTACAQPLVLPWCEAWPLARPVFTDASALESKLVCQLTDTGSMV
jgi:hypothetical protein